MTSTIKTKLKAEKKQLPIHLGCKEGLGRGMLKTKKTMEVTVKLKRTQ